MDVVDESLPAPVLATSRSILERRPEGGETPARSGVAPWRRLDQNWPPAGLAFAVLVPVVAFGIALRFWTNSDMWLDEALTVNISKLPVSQIHGALMRDGSPPLYYYLLHYWMKVFGSSDYGARSLSGVFSVATLPLVWTAGRRLGGRTVAFCVTILIATSPFAVYYGTEARMYSLVAFLTAAGFLALDNALRGPTRWNLVATGLCAALLLYAHYWAIYLVAMTGAWLLFQAWRGPERRRRSARSAFFAMAVGCLLFIPWIPTFVYQSQHTGTPWATPANFADLVWAIITFGGGPSNQGFALSMMYYALAGLGLFGLARDRSRIVLDLRGRPATRGLSIVVIGTLTLAIILGYLQKSTFSPRYASIIFVPLLLIVAMGLKTFADRRIVAVILVAAGWFGLASAIPNISSQRSQAVNIAAALARLGKPGDVVAYCPDQLGPDASRLLPAGRYQQIAFPRGNSPEFVDWVNYASVTGAASPFHFVSRLEQMSGGDHTIWYVWAPGYATYGNKCGVIQSALGADRGLVQQQIIQFQPSTFYEPMQLVEFAPRNS